MEVKLTRGQLVIATAVGLAAFIGKELMLEIIFSGAGDSLKANSWIVGDFLEWRWSSVIIGVTTLFATAVALDRLRSDDDKEKRKLRLHWPISLETERAMRASEGAHVDESLVVGKTIEIAPPDYAELKAIEARNRERLADLIINFGQMRRFKFRELTATHDQFFEIHLTLFNASIFQLSEEVRVEGNINFQDRQMQADISVSRARTDDGRAWLQGLYATLVIKVVPRSPDTIRVLRAAAEQYEIVDIYPNLLLVLKVAGHEEIITSIAPFMGAGSWRSDIYERQS